MKTITKEFKVYKYEELKKEVREEVRESFDFENQGIFNDMFSEDTEELLKMLPINYKEKSLQYSLSYSQGDGLCFETDNNFSCDMIKLSEMLKKSEYPEEGYIFLEKIFNDMKEYFILSDKEEEIVKKYDFYYKIIQNGHYCHSYTMYIDSDFDYFEEEEPTKEEEELIEKLEDKLVDGYRSIARTLAKKGYETIYYKMTEEEMIELCNANDYEFLEDGELF